MKVYRYLMVVMMLGGAVAGAYGQAATNFLGFLMQETNGGNYKVTQELKNSTLGSPGDVDKSFNVLVAEVSLSDEGCSGFQTPFPEPVRFTLSMSIPT